MTWLRSLMARFIGKPTNPAASALLNARDALLAKFGERARAGDSAGARLHLDEARRLEREAYRLLGLRR